MNLLKQMAVTLVLVTCATIAMARYYPASHAVLNSLGVPANLISMIALPDDPNDEATGRPGGGRSATAVITAPISTGAISTQVQAVGSSEAVRSVSVVPLDAGVLTQVAVGSGDVVAGGDLLAQLNADTEEIARDRAAVVLRSAQAEYTRYASLGQASAASQADLDTLLAARDDAELALREANVALENRSVFAPIGGVVGIVPVEVGDYVTTATEIAMIDDRSQIVVDFWVPERFASFVAIGQPVKANPLALSADEFIGTVSAIGSRVETDSRTFQVRALIENTADLLRPGMSFAISMAFDGDTYPSVDPLAVQWDAEGSYVWAVTDGVAKRVPVQIVQRNADAVLIEADIAEGVHVVTEGTLNVRDGVAVTVQSDATTDGSVADAGGETAVPTKTGG
ncbi:efflux RND transporter periplasmic adaptor subunit [Octadecabacter sp. G9-8]|uniref:Efflux RND transporter periplasmic adaptor subunit n=1 Tax=Octadecabacter dasysiphoniae TaxID=2909341 RepID=A0ABS9CUA8_9RHOB|nr:efflux RND transporter periplasmic adaptor subunit [Octadecabacter dasysiphoniae]MCF2870748.1 efflux RND transporter periplasmic adaptor subunit [Octadecabacter dasysiphoniae]